MGSKFTCFNCKDSFHYCSCSDTQLVNCNLCEYYKYTALDICRKGCTNVNRFKDIQCKYYKEIKNNCKNCFNDQYCRKIGIYDKDCFISKELSEKELNRTTCYPCKNAVFCEQFHNWWCNKYDSLIKLVRSECLEEKESYCDSCGDNNMECKCKNNMNEASCNTCEHKENGLDSAHTCQSCIVPHLNKKNNWKIKLPEKNKNLTWWEADKLQQEGWLLNRPGNNFHLYEWQQDWHVENIRATDWYVVGRRNK